MHTSYDQFAGRATTQDFLPVLAERFARQRLKALARVEGKHDDGLPIVLFLCTHNAGRSQMALGWFEHLAGDNAVAWSGGSEPGAEVNPAAIAAMAEVGINISREYPKPWTDEILQAADVVVTMGCGDACPLFPGKRYEDWVLDDPAGMGVAAVRPIRDEIGRRVRELLGNPRRPLPRCNHGTATTRVTCETQPTSDQESAMPGVGDTAPDFTLKDQNGDDVTLSALRGKPVVIVFYPFTFTGVCQGELCEIRDDPSAFERAGAQVLAISCDSRHSQRMWAEQQGYTFPVLSDFWPHGEVAKAYGVFNEALGCANRATFVIDADGKISSTFSSPDLGTPRAKQEYDDALAKVS